MNERQPKPNLIGKVINTVRERRWVYREKIEKDLWIRNNLANVEDREGYKIVEDTRRSKNGSESTTFQLWHLVDQSKVDINIEITTKITDGKESPHVDTKRKIETGGTDSPL